MATWINAHGEFEDDFEPFDWGMAPDYSPLSEAEKRRKCKSKAHPVVCIDTGAAFPSVTAAAVSAGVSGASITGAIKEGTRCRGMRWRYA